MVSDYISVSAATFRTELLPGPSLNARQLKKLGNFTEVNSIWAGEENDICLHLCRELNAIVNLAGGNSTFKDVTNRPGISDTNHGPAMALYPTHQQAADSYTLSKEDALKSAASAMHGKHIAYCAYQWMVAAIEVKEHGAESGFSFEPGEPLLRPGEKAGEARIQFATYAAEIMLRQHRTHLYMFYISGWWARAFRWDRNGVVVSHPIDLRTNSKQLFNMIYHLVLADPRMQGFDTTASLASDAEIQKLQLYGPTNTYLEEYKNMMVKHIFEYPIYKVECDEVLQRDEPRRTRSSRRKQFLIGKYIAGGYAPIGRATKGWVAYCLDDNVLVFLKEQWRANAIGVHPELETYARLRQHDVLGVATAIAGGDVGGPRDLHKTMSQKYFNKQGFDIPERIQTRLVLEEVGRPLETYEDSIELILVTTQALVGHQQAWDKAGILHRDVSVGNILIDTASAPGEPRGFLNDWDLCKYEEELGQQLIPLRPSGVSGTWAFGSALSLMYPRKPKELADDLESFIYVPTYCAFRYHDHDLSSPNLDLLKNATREKQVAEDHGDNSTFTIAKYTFFYQEHRHANGLYSGGRTKYNNIKACMPPVLLKKRANKTTPLANLLQNSYDLLRRHYQAIDLDELEGYKADYVKPASVASDIVSPEPENSQQLAISAFNIMGIQPPSMPNTFASSLLSSPGSTAGSCTRVLDTHSELVGVFVAALLDKKGQPLVLTPFLSDKYYDQFDNNKVVIRDTISNPSSSISRSKKRKSSDSGLDVDPRPSQKPKKT